MSKDLTEHNLREFQLYALIGTASDKLDFADKALGGTVAEHVEFLRRLERDGVMFMGGPFRAPDYEWNGSGMLFVRAASLSEAQAVADRDPLFVAGLRTYDVRGWQLNEGQIRLTVELDSSSIIVA